MTDNSKISTIGDIRTQLASAVKSWRQMTSDLSWPESDQSLAAMDIHISTLRAVNAQLAQIEDNMPSAKQQSLAICFDEEAVQDPGKFARFAQAVEMAMAA